MAIGSKLLTVCFFMMFFLSISLVGSSSLIALQIHHTNQLNHHNPNSTSQNPNSTSQNPNSNHEDPNSLSLFQEISVGIILAAVLTTFMGTFVSEFKCVRMKSNRNWLNYSAIFRSLFDVTMIFFVRLAIHTILPSQSVVSPTQSLMILPAVGLQMVMNTFVAIMLRKGLLEFFGIWSTGVANLLLFAQTVNNWRYIACIWGSYVVVAVMVGFLIGIFPDLAAGGAAH